MYIMYSYEAWEEGKSAFVFDSGCCVCSGVSVFFLLFFDILEFEL